VFSYVSLRVAPTFREPGLLYIAGTPNKNKGKEQAMSDEADIANEQVELNRLAAIEACRHRPGIIPKGSCWFCEEELPLGQKFCDRDCAADYEAEQAAMVRNGRPSSHELQLD
jgi:hypothetical protein